MMMKRCGTTKAARRTAASPALAPAASVVPAVSNSGRCQLRPAVEEKQRASALVLPRRVSSGSRSGTTAHVFGLFGGGNDDEDYDEAYTVAKIQVAMFGNVRKYQQQLELLSEMYDTDDEESLHTVMRETVKFLLRNLSHVGYAQTAGKIFDNMDDCEAKFNSVSLEESAKFKEETYSNVDGEKQRKVFQGQGADVGLDEWLAVTVLVAVERKLKLPKISTQQDLKTALTDTAGCPAEELLAFELLWTPQAEGDSYSKDDLLVDYPTLALL